MLKAWRQWQSLLCSWFWFLPWQAFSSRWPKRPSFLSANGRSGKWPNASRGLGAWCSDCWARRRICWPRWFWAIRSPPRPLLLLETLAIPLRRLAQVVNTAILKAAEPTAFSPQPVLTDADYQELLELAFQQGALAQSERDIILQIINLDRRIVKEVMKPR